MVFYGALAQTALLAWARPGQRWDWASSFHRAKIEWVLDSTCKDHAAALSAVLEAAAPRSLSHLYVMPRQNQAPLSGKFIRLPAGGEGREPIATIITFTPLMQFLDIVRLEAEPMSGNGVRLTATSMSACCLPAWFPLGFLLGFLLFWLPFPDTGANRRNLAAVRRSIEASAAGVTVVGERLLEAGAGATFRDTPLGRMAGSVPSSLLFFCGYMLPLASIVMGLLLHSSSLAASARPGGPSSLSA